VKQVLIHDDLTVDGVDVAEQSAVELEPGQEHEVRFEGVELKKGEHKLTALADANREVTETDEGNNTLTVTATCTASKS
jgi:subtilase family serine protease